MRKWFEENGERRKEYAAKYITKEAMWKHMNKFGK